MLGICKIVLKELATVLVAGLLVIGIVHVTNVVDVWGDKNTEEGYPLYSEHDAMVQQPVMFTLNHDLVSDKGDMFGYCLTAKSKDVECYTMNGRFIGVGNVKLYYDGNDSSVYVMAEAPTEYRRVMNNAFLRVWAD